MEIRATGEVEDVDNVSMHGSEALDALAAIKLKVALLKEHIYLDKMNAIAWGEVLVNNGAIYTLLLKLSDILVFFSYQECIPS